MSFLEDIYLNSTLNCSTPQYFSVYKDFFECYKEFFRKNILGAVGQICLGIVTGIFCLAVLSFLILKSNKTIFDIILLSHSK